MSFDLPPALGAALRAFTEGVSRRDLMGRAASISDTYRSGGTSAPIISRLDALAYALVRMPATYAALAACLAALREVRPDFAPASLLDVGAGPGTGIWAAAETFSTLESFAALDANRTLRGFAMELVANHSRLAGLRYEEGSAQTRLAEATAAELTIASYVLGEIAEPERAGFIDDLAARTQDMLLLVEPGTPAGYARIIAARERLIVAGLHVAAPCPHNKLCPLEAPDWCHFAQRVQRSRDHRLIKGAELPFEDEKFSYIAVSRRPLKPANARVLRPPEPSKSGLSLRLCAAASLENGFIPRRDKKAFARMRRLAWGDAIFDRDQPE